MNTGTLKNNLTSTPAFVFDGDEISRTVNNLSRLKVLSGCRVLYSIKALPLFFLLEWLKPHVDGFSVSSLFESRLALESLAGQGSIHLTTPGIRQQEIPELSRLCSHISANSMNQLQLLLDLVRSNTSIGVRINPELPFISDERYNPCRPFSKLGVTIEQLLASGLATQIKGLHFHTVFSADSYEPLSETIAKLRPLLVNHELKLDWLNFGGGYLYGQIDDNTSFIKLVRELRENNNLEVYIEPGNSVVGSFGYLIASVIDLFTSGGKNVAVLDTSVNHLPEVFEYQRSPILAEHYAKGSYSALLAGSTCLAGDLFGEYRFKEPLKIGSRLVFTQVGAYTLVKAHRFNGYNLPDIYFYESGECRRVKSHSYEDFRGHWLNDA